MNRVFALLASCLVCAACGDETASSTLGTGGSVVSGGGSGGGGALGTGGLGFGGAGGDTSLGGGASVEMFPELWYSVDQWLVLIRLNEADGAVADIEWSTITLELDAGQTAITMLADGSLLVARLSSVDSQSHFFHILVPARDGSDVTPVELGVMPNGIMLEGLYTDCEGRVYGMDTGVDVTSAQGNRLLRFTGDVTAGDFAFAVVSDLATADVADIDDMSPGIDANEITDNPGLAIDTGNIHVFNYETGSGTLVAQAGMYGMHALGGPLFQDGQSRLYVLSYDAELFAIDPIAYTSSDVLGTGPVPAEGIPGWSGLAGPLTDCETGFTPPR